MSRTGRHWWPRIKSGRRDWCSPDTRRTMSWACSARCWKPPGPRSWPPPFEASWRPPPSGRSRRRGADLVGRTVSRGRGGLMDISDLLVQTKERGASDLHLKVGSPPTFRINGTLVRIDGPPLDRDGMHAMLFDILTDEQKAKFE